MQIEDRLLNVPGDISWISVKPLQDQTGQAELRLEHSRLVESLIFQTRSSVLADRKLSQPDGSAGIYR